MVLQVEPKGVFGQVLTQVLFVEDSAVHAFQIFDLLPVIVFVETYIVQGLDLALSVGVLESVGVSAEELGLRVE